MTKWKKRLPGNLANKRNRLWKNLRTWFFHRSQVLQEARIISFFKQKQHKRWNQEIRNKRVELQNTEGTTVELLWSTSQSGHKVRNSSSQNISQNILDIFLVHHNCLSCINLESFLTLMVLKRLSQHFLSRWFWPQSGTNPFDKKVVDLNWECNRVSSTDSSKNYA